VLIIVGRGPPLVGASLFPHHQVIDMAPKLV
jgi:hypothetical protein